MDRRKLSIEFAILLMIESSCSFSAKNTGRLYRVDLRGPDEIFNDGFQSFGDNDDVRDHSRGASCRGRDENSVFISLSADPEYAASYARRLFQLHESPVYVYIINSTHSMYNMTSSLRYINYQAGIRDTETQSEWIAYRSIPPVEVIGVREYSGSDTPAIRYNPISSRDRQWEINPDPYHSGQFDSYPGAPVYAGLRPTVTSCMSASLYCFNSQSFGYKEHCNYIEELGGKLPALLMGQLTTDVNHDEL